MNADTTSVRRAVRYGRGPGSRSCVFRSSRSAIGASTAVASAIHALLVRPLPLPNAERLVTGFALREGFDPFGTSLLEYEAFGARARAFERIGLARRQPATLRVDSDSIRVQAAAITGSYLPTAGVTPALGRAIAPDDDRPGAPAVVAIGHGLWVRQIAARADVIGTTLLVDGRPATVVGVMPAMFDLPNGAELWMPMQIVPGALTMEQRLQSAYTFLGRLRPDASIASANTDVLAIARGLADEYPAQRRGWTFRVLGLRQYLIGDVDGRTSRTIAIVAAAVALLMALCYVNVASLLLLYAADRQRAYAVRLAIGASARQLTLRTLRGVRRDWIGRRRVRRAAGIVARAADRSADSCQRLVIRHAADGLQRRCHDDGERCDRGDGDGDRGRTRGRRRPCRPGAGAREVRRRATVCHRF